MTNGMLQRLLVAVLGSLLAAATTGTWTLYGEFSAMRQDIAALRETVRAGLASAETRMDRIEDRMEQRLRAREQPAKR